MMKLEKKPWNEIPASQYASRAFRIFSVGHRCAGNMSWRQIAKAMNNPRTANTRNGRKLTKREWWGM